MTGWTGRAHAVPTASVEAEGGGPVHLAHPDRPNAYEFFSPDSTGPKRSQVSPLKRIICNCSSGA
jgi:hypothetical protein